MAEPHRGGKAMLEIIRRIGVAIGSLVAAALCVGLLGTLIPPLTLHVSFDVLPIGLLVPGPSTGGVALSTIVILVLGGLIYRDILRHEGRNRH